MKTSTLSATSGGASKRTRVESALIKCNLLDKWRYARASNAPAREHTCKQFTESLLVLTP